MWSIMAPINGNVAEDITPTTMVYVVRRDDGLIPYTVSLHSGILSLSFATRRFFCQSLSILYR
jgi:hypothetical protein